MQSRACVMFCSRHRVIREAVTLTVLPDPEWTALIVGVNTVLPDPEWTGPPSEVNTGPAVPSL